MGRAFARTIAAGSIAARAVTTLLAATACDAPTGTTPAPTHPPPPPKPENVGYLVVGVSGRGTVKSDETPPLIDCGERCSAEYAHGTKVHLSIATVEEGWVFDRWDGDDDCDDNDLTIGTLRRCTAVFIRDRTNLKPLEIQVEGQGTVFFPELVNAPGCDSACTKWFRPNSEVQLSALPATGWTMWRVGGDPDCADGRVTLDAGKHCTVVFAVDPAAHKDLRIEIAGLGSVGVHGPTVTPDCKRTCLRTFPAGAAVTLEPINDPDRRSHFRGWAGDPDCADGQITLDADKRCFARFAGGNKYLYLNVDGGGVVRFDPGTAPCDHQKNGQPSDPCQILYGDGERPILEPIPDQGWAFDGWEGDCRSGVPALENDIACVARFRPASGLAPGCTPGALSAPPRTVRARADACHSAFVSWDAPQGDGCVAGYNVYRNGRLLERIAGPVQSADDLRLLRGGRTYAYAVEAIGTDGSTSPRSPPAQLTLPDCPALPSRMRVKVLLGRLLEYPGEPISKDSAKSQLFNPISSVGAYLKEVSFGKVELTGDVHGWYTLPGNLEEYCAGKDEFGAFDCNYPKMDADLIQLADREVDFSGVHRVVIVWHKIGDLGGQAGGFVATGEGLIEDLIEVSSAAFQVRVIAHELGHTIAGTMHAGTWTCGAGPVPFDLSDPLVGGCRIDTYGDLVDVMGSGTNHFSAYRKERMGFFDPANVADVPDAGLFTLHALEVPSREVQELRIPLDPAQPEGDFYSVEYRRPIGFDRLDVLGRRNDVAMIRIALAYPVTGSDDTLTSASDTLIGVGAPFFDPYRGIAVDLFATGDDRALLRVRRGVR